MLTQECACLSGSSKVTITQVNYNIQLKTSFYTEQEKKIANLHNANICHSQQRVIAHYMHQASLFVPKKQNPCGFKRSDKSTMTHYNTSTTH
jgi:hypothetical protein